MDQASNDLANLLLGDDADVQDVGEQSEEAPAGVRVIENMLETDPESRRYISEQILGLASRGLQADQAPAPPQQQASQMTPLQQVNAGIAELLQKKAEFRKLDEKDPNKDYMQYEEWNDQIHQLEAYRAQLMQEQQEQMSTRLTPADSGMIIEQFIQEEGRRQAKRHGKAYINQYADKVREIAKELRPEVMADATKLKNALRQAVEPMALKQHVMARGGSARGDAAPSGSYGGGGQPDIDPNEEFPNMVEGESEFLQAMGLIERAPQGAQGLRQVEAKKGYAMSFGVTPGKKNA